jgi:hypothetical protein
VHGSGMIGAGWACATAANAKVSTTSAGAPRSKPLTIRESDFIDVDPFSIAESAADLRPIHEPKARNVRDTQPR